MSMVRKDCFRNASFREAQKQRYFHRKHKSDINRQFLNTYLKDEHKPFNKPAFIFHICFPYYLFFGMFNNSKVLVYILRKLYASSRFPFQSFLLIKTPLFSVHKCSKSMLVVIINFHPDTVQ